MVARAKRARPGKINPKRKIRKVLTNKGRLLVMVANTNCDQGKAR